MHLKIIRHWSISMRVGQALRMYWLGLTYSLDPLMSEVRPIKTSHADSLVSHISNQTWHYNCRRRWRKQSPYQVVRHTHPSWALCFHQWRGCSHHWSYAWCSHFRERKTGPPKFASKTLERLPSDPRWFSRVPLQWSCFRQGREEETENVIQHWWKWGLNSWVKTGFTKF